MKLEIVYNKGWRCPRESNASKNKFKPIKQNSTTLTLNELSEIFHNIGSAKDKMLEADSNSGVWHFAQAQKRYAWTMF